MARRGTPFTGVLFAGIYGPRPRASLIEYNVRFGVQMQVLMLRLQSRIARHTTSHGTRDAWRSTCRLLRSSRAHRRAGNARLSGQSGQGQRRSASAEGHDRRPDGLSRHTLRRDGKLIANGGRVLNITALGSTVAGPAKRAYAALDQIDPKASACDIGWRADMDINVHGRLDVTNILVGSPPLAPGGIRVRWVSLTFA